jgi:hypothetical protein
MYVDHLYFKNVLQYVDFIRIVLSRAYCWKAEAALRSKKSISSLVSKRSLTTPRERLETIKVNNVSTKPLCNTAGLTPVPERPSSKFKMIPPCTRCESMYRT